MKHTHRRKCELVIAGIRRHLAAPTTPDRYDDLWHTTWDHRRFDVQLAGDIGKTRQLIEVARVVREATGPGCAVAEEQIMKCMEAVVGECCNRFEDAGMTGLAGFASFVALAPKLRPCAPVVAELRAYAMECFQYAARPRDTFAGARRGLALSILGLASRLCDSTDVLAIVRQALRRNRSQEVRGAINFLENYFAAREELPLPDDIADGLLAVAEKTKSRSTAVGALNVLVETRVISEWEASDRMSEWKEKHCR